MPFLVEADTPPPQPVRAFIETIDFVSSSTALAYPDGTGYIPWIIDRTHCKRGTTPGEGGGGACGCVPLLVLPEVDVVLEGQEVEDGVQQRDDHGDHQHDRVRLRQQLLTRKRHEAKKRNGTKTARNDKTKQHETINETSRNENTISPHTDRTHSIVHITFGGGAAVTLSTPKQARGGINTSL